jgi:hypothetical protein
LVSVDGAVIVKSLVAPPLLRMQFQTALDRLPVLRVAAPLHFKSVLGSKMSVTGTSLMEMLVTASRTVTVTLNMPLPPLFVGCACCGCLGAVCLFQRGGDGDGGCGLAGVG